MKKISLITITSNNLGIKETLNSVVSQNISSSKIEHIIVDNFSTDNTEIIVKNYQKQAKHHTVYIREKDTGRYNAMNKGILAATGKYLLFLNAGDKLHQHDVLSTILKYLDTDIVYGDITGLSLKKFSINRQFFIDRNLFHQATFIKRSLFDKVGLYDETLIISGDFDFFIKAIIKHHVSTSYLPLTISDYDPNGISSQQSDLVYGERALVITRYYSGLIYLYNLIKYLYYKNKKLFPGFITRYQSVRLQNKPKI